MSPTRPQLRPVSGAQVASLRCPILRDGYCYSTPSSFGDKAKNPHAGAARIFYGRHQNFTFLNQPERVLLPLYLTTEATMAQKHGGTWTKRTGYDEGPDADDFEHGIPRQSFQKHHSSMGAVHVHHDAGLGVAGRVLHMVGVFVPMLAGELVQDATKYKKTVRLASIGTAIGYEVLHVVKEQQRQSAMQSKLDECRSRD